MKNIVLVLPNFRWKKAKKNIMWHYVPYGLCILAAVLEESTPRGGGKYNVSIIDAYKENLSTEEFEMRIRQSRPDAVGLGVLMDYFGVTCHIAAQIIKNYDKNIPIIIGGVYATTNIERVMKDNNIDFLIAGDGEYTLPILLEHIFNNKGIATEGIYYRDEGGDLKGKGLSPLVVNLDSLPFPAYHLINYKEYINNVSRNSVDRPPALPYAEIQTSRGCPHNCCFCQAKYITGRKYRCRSAENVLEEVDWLIKDYGVKSVVIVDDNFFVDRNRAIAIMQGFKERHLPWKMIATALFLLDDELIEIMKDSGCSYIDCAVESGTERVLHKVIHKPIKSLDQVRKIVKKAQSVGIFVAVNFIVGFPGESWDEIRATIKFADELNADYTKLFNAVPLPHTELYDICEKCGYLVDDYDSMNIDWKSGYIETDDFFKEDLLFLRAYEWDRINYTDPQKRKRIADMMNITEEELLQIRKETRLDAISIIQG